MLALAVLLVGLVLAASARARAGTRAGLPA
jgi:hypothetical protein